MEDPMMYETAVRPPVTLNISNSDTYTGRVNAAFALTILNILIILSPQVNMMYIGIHS